MTFDSLTFVVFLALTFVAYWATPSWTARKVLVLVCSYVFYAAWNPFFVVLIIATTGFDWFAARWMDRTRILSRRKAIMAASIAINLSALGFFKYAQFFVDNAVDLLRIFGVDYKPLSLGILLPVGISFYTFESLSYVIDVYRKRIEVSKNLLDYGLYVTFFPHLVAGPILRYGDFSPQCLEPKSWHSAPVGRGLTLLVFGLALKVCLADLVFAPVADRVFAPGAEPGFAESWLGGAAFSLQVLCDFGGYSLCAIGTALMFGFRFPMNFESPFGSVGIAELWTRWHMSLASWMRDYVLQPLGGYRKGRARGHFNVLVTFVLVGLWHGAAWTFVLWGALHGLFLIGERLLRQYVWDFTRVRNVPARAMLAIATFGLFAFAAVLFRASSIGQAWAILTTMLSPWTRSALVPFEVSMVAIFAGAVMIGAQIRYGHLRGWDWLENWSVTPRAVSIALALMAILLSPGLNPAFIYFQF
ncbi:MAG TPA: MBOAT family O-acyltransferase [Casimicrobiaceae bacterium]|jgi:D-alanyl-lipoteichoic acid acyltransferase DltB (MBOAT superfamily)